MFGDKDIEEPDEDYADWECDSEEEAQEWFDNYDEHEDSEWLADYDKDDEYYFESIKNKRKLLKNESKGIKESKEPMSIDAHKFSDMRKDDILNVLDDMPVGTTLSGIVNAPGTYGAEHFGHLGDVVVKKRSAYVANIYNPISSPDDWKYKDIYWTISGDKKYNWDIANIILGKDKYYCLSEFNGIKESINIMKAKRLLENNGYIVNKKLRESENDDDKNRREMFYCVMNLMDNAFFAVSDAVSGIDKMLIQEKYPKSYDMPFDVYLSNDERNDLYGIRQRLDKISDDIEDWFGYDIFE